MSGNTNIVVIEGRLTRDPSYNKTANGKSICKFSLANNRYYYSENELKNEVSFFDFVSFGRLADRAAVNLHKGRHILINGEIRQDTYITKTGEKKQKIYIVALDVKYLDKKNMQEHFSDSHLLNNHINNRKLSESIEENLEKSF